MGLISRVSSRTYRVKMPSATGDNCDETRHDWSMSSVQGWRGLRPSNKELLLTKPLNLQEFNSSYDPPGWDNSFLNQHTLDDIVAANEGTTGVDAEQRDRVMNQIAWNAACGPIKGIPMMAFMMWMTGNQIGIFPIMMLGMQLFRTLQTFANFKQTTKAFEKSELKHLQMALWLFGQMCVLGIAAWKCNSMGLLPTHPS